MKEQLIEILKRYQQTFKLGSDGEYTTCYAVDEEDFDIVSDEIIQALTSVKSAEEVEKLNQEDTSYIAGYERAMHDFANNSEEMKEVQITFGNHLKAHFKIVDNKIEILDAVNGWGDNVQTTEIKVEYLTNKEK
jgi:hypothetical protein